jgi:hypothetical protein
MGQGTALNIKQTNSPCSCGLEETWQTNLHAKKKSKQIYPIVSSCALVDTRMRTGAPARSKGAKNHTKSTRTKTLTLASMQHVHQNTYARTHARAHARMHASKNHTTIIPC